MAKLYEQLGLPSNIVYLKEMKVSDLPEDVQGELDASKPVFDVFDEEGSQIALVDDVFFAREMAKEHSFNLQTLH